MSPRACCACKGIKLTQAASRKTRFSVPGKHARAADKSKGRPPSFWRARVSLQLWHRLRRLPSPPPCRSLLYPDELGRGRGAGGEAAACGFSLASSQIGPYTSLSKGGHPVGNWPKSLFLVRMSAVQ